MLTAGLLVGLQMVQPGGLHGVCAGIRGSGDRLARAGEEILFGAILPAALHLPPGSLHQGPQLGRAGLEQGHDPG